MKNCKLCTILENEKDKYLYEDDWCVILPTKYMKGHHKRVMIVSKEHDVEEGQSLTIYLLAIFANFCRDYFDEEPTFALVESTYASIPEHWHRIASDWFGYEDINQLHYTPHVALQTNVKWNPK